MWVLFLCVIAIAICIIIGWMIRRYPLSTVPFSVRCLTVCAWLVSVSMFAFVPIDVGATLESTENNAVTLMWKISYWSTQILTWLVIPLFQGYIESAEFTFTGKLISSIKSNLVFYGIMTFLTILGFIFLILSGKSTLAAIPGTCIALSNTFGLCVVVFLLGYGLVTVPKYLWHTANPQDKLKLQTYKIGRLSVKIGDSIAELERVFVIIQACSQQIARRDFLRPFINIICEEIERNYPKDLEIIKGQSFRDLCKLLTSDELDYALDLNGLSSLRQRMRNAINSFEGAKAEYVKSVSDSFKLLEICERKDKGDFYTQAIINIESGARYKIYANAIYWYFKCIVAAVLQRAFSLLLAGLSILVVWSEITIIFESIPNLSPFSNITKNSEKDLSVYVIATLPLIYIGFCTYHMLFNLSAFKFYHLIPGATPSYSLLLNGSLLCRFTAPLVYNYLNVIRVNSLDSDASTSFSKVMGAMKVLPFFGTDLNKWLPIFLLIMCLFMLFKFSERLFTGLVPSKFRLSGDEADDSYLRKGDMLITRERQSIFEGKDIGEVLGFESKLKQSLKQSQSNSRTNRGSANKDEYTDSSSSNRRFLDGPFTGHQECSNLKKEGVNNLDSVFSSLTENSGKK